VQEYMAPGYSTIHPSGNGTIEHPPNLTRIPCDAPGWDYGSSPYFKDKEGKQIPPKPLVIPEGFQIDWAIVLTFGQPAFQVTPPLPIGFQRPGEDNPDTDPFAPPDTFPPLPRDR
jgi:hypothetical protein